MSRMTLAVSGMLLGLATQAFAAEAKFDTRSCYAGPVHLIQTDGMISGSYAVVGMLPGAADSPPPLKMMSARCVVGIFDYQWSAG